MKYLMRCEKCKGISEIEILTHDIINARGSVNQHKLEERLQEPQFCECGGQLRKHYQWGETFTPLGRRERNRRVIEDMLVKGEITKEDLK